MDNAAGPGMVPDRDREFDRLVEEYQGPVLRMCFLTLRDRTLAEDAAQETFLKVYRTMDTFRGECSEKTWIMKIAVRTCYDMNRSGWFRFMNRRVTPEMLPEQAAEESDPRDDELTAAVLRLPLKLREAVLLHHYQGLNVNETAEALGISHSSASGRLKRGREKLKELLEGSELYEP